MEIDSFTFFFGCLVMIGVLGVILNFIVILLLIRNRQVIISKIY